MRLKESFEAQVKKCSELIAKEFESTQSLILARSKNRNLLVLSEKLNVQAEQARSDLEKAKQEISELQGHLQAREKVSKLVFFEILCLKLVVFLRILVSLSGSKRTKK